MIHQASRYRIAFLTPEFPTESQGSRGGLSNYLFRCASALQQLGHEVEVFTASSEPLQVVEYRGLSVHRVPSAVRRLPASLAWMQRLPGPSRPVIAIKCLRAAAALAEVFEQRHNKFPFHLVQSSDFDIPAYFLPRLPGLRHIVRCSSSRSWIESVRPKRWGIGRPHDQFLLKRFERRLLHQADGCYAPSHYAAQQFSRRYGVEIGVVRPPFFLEAMPETEPHGSDLPKKFLLFIGQFNRIKGADILARALRICWEQQSDLKILWAGAGDIAAYHDLLGPHAENAISLGPIAKDRVYQLMRVALATVAPSRIDNLPNVVIESLAMGTPVIGTRGVSIDELVVEGESGTLVDCEDVHGLARAMLAAWNNQVPWLGETFRRPPIFDELDPPRAVERLLEFAGLDAGIG